MNAYGNRNAKKLNARTEAVYCVHRCSSSSRTPHTRYTRTSSGRNSGWRNVRRPLKTRDMNSPIGFVTSRIKPKNTRICKIPVLVMAASKPLGLEHRPPEIHEQEHCDDAGNDVIEHVRSPTRGRTPS